MKSVFILLYFICLCYPAEAQNSWLWGKADVAHKASLKGAASTTVDQYGNVYLCGGVQDSIFPYCSNVYLTKYDATGNLLWYQTGGGKWYDEATSMTLDSGNNVYITGYIGWDGGGGWAITDTVYFGDTMLVTSYYDIFIAKYNSNGHFLWAKKFGGDFGDIATIIKADAGGNIYLSGRYAGDNYPNSGAATFDTITLTSFQDGDIFLAKFDTSGYIQWVRSIGSSEGSDIGYSIDFDSINNIYLSGNFGGDKCFFDSYQLNSLSSGFVSGNMFVAKYDPLGNFVWVTTAGGINNSSGSIGAAVSCGGVAVAPGGDVYVSGGYQHCSMNFGNYILPNASGNTEEIFLVKYNSSGQRRWAKGFGSESDDMALATAVDELGRVYITGYYGYPISFGGDTLAWKGANDIFIACFDSSGNHVMSTSVADAGTESATSIVVRNGGQDIYIAGVVLADTMEIGNLRIPTGWVSRDFVAHGSMLTGISAFPYRHDVSVYPNPATGIVNLSGVSQNTRICVYDAAGKLVYYRIVDKERGAMSIDLACLSRGIYILELSSKQGVTRKKIVLQ